MGSLYLA